MKIVFIQPTAYKHAPEWVTEPLNLGYLAAYLRERGYRDLSIRASYMEPEEDVIAEASQADIVGITATSTMMTHGRELAKNIKDNSPNTIIIFGGTHPTVAPESTLEDGNIDFVVRGEGEITTYELVRAIDNGAALESIDGLSYRQKGRVVHNPNRALIQDIDTIPFPARDLMNQGEFTRRHFAAQGKRAASIFTSRGCPYRCTYCASHAVWTRRVRMRSAENVVAEIKELKEAYQVEHLLFHDDTFTLSKNRVIQFCDLLQRDKGDITWACNVHINTVDLEVLQRMRDAGCVEIWIGVESGSQVILKELRKGTTVARIRKVFQMAKEAGLERHAYLMIGSPSESKETIRETERLLEEVQPEYASVAVFTPYPGCDYYEQAKAQNYVDDNIDWSVIDLHFTVTLPSKYLSREELALEHKRLSKKLTKYRKKRKRFNLPYLRYRSLELLRTSSPRDYPKLGRKLLSYLKAGISHG